MGRLVPSLMLVLASSLAPLLLPIARNLEYEYATLNAYLLLLLLPVGLYLLPDQSAPKPWTALKTLLLAAVLSFVPPFLMFRFGGCRCSEQGYWFWWVIQVLPHLVLAHGVAWYMLKARADRRRNVLAVYFVIMGVLLFEMAWILWAMPQKRITHLVAGFIHGAIYDNFIGVDDGIVWTRAGHLMVGLIFVSLALFVRRTKWALAASALAMSLVFSFVASHYASTAHGLAALEELMPETRESRFFTLHYQKPENDDQVESINQIFASAEFHSQDIA